MKAKKQQLLEGKFQHVFYSPKGQVEGLMLDVDGEVIQVIFEHHDKDSAKHFLSLKQGQVLVIKATTKALAPKGVRAHLVYTFIHLDSIDGHKPTKHIGAKNAASSGVVAYFNYARHGAANGVVLDTGDFIHVKPEGFSRFTLKVGDRVSAAGAIHQLLSGTRRVVDAVRINGKNVIHR